MKSENHNLDGQGSTRTVATYLRIPYENSKARELAKKNGAKWQSQAKIWKLDGECPTDLEQFKIEVEVATYSLESLIASRLDKSLDLLKAVFADADLNEELAKPNREPHWQVLELVGQTPLTPGTQVPARKHVQRLARELAASLLWATEQRDLAVQLQKVEG